MGRSVGGKRIKYCIYVKVVGHIQIKICLLSKSLSKRANKVGSFSVWNIPLIFNDIKREHYSNGDKGTCSVIG